MRIWKRWCKVTENGNIARSGEIDLQTVLYKVINNNLGCQKVTSSWVPKHLIEDHKYKRRDISFQVLEQFRAFNRTESVVYENEMLCDIWKCPLLDSQSNWLKNKSSIGGKFLSGFWNGLGDLIKWSRGNKKTNT